MSLTSSSIKVMVAGIGGASLGTEICKCLLLTEKYEIYGCDISPTAYGLYDSGFAQTYRVSRENYVADVLDICRRTGIKWVIPGGEQPNALLSAATELFTHEDIRVVANDAAIVGLLSDKDATFNKLAACGIPIPKTTELTNADNLKIVGMPCIVKPATGSGGSASVFFATSIDEALTYGNFIRRNGSVPIVQEYVSDEEGEFTIGVLSLPDGQLAGSEASYLFRK